MAWGEVWHHRGREGEDWDGRFLATHWQMLAGIGAPLMQYDPSEPRSRVQGSTDLLVGIGTCLIWVHGSTFKMKGPAVFGHSWQEPSIFCPISTHAHLMGKALFGGFNSAHALFGHRS